uniref:Uncharacterized protein n=1 Tax=Vitrella brassicaformis TaxID=1169539 RepID=A0A7S1PB85_9ALVE|mmetsp:Transcript_48419/g.121233  ORF Transcript_48419/g.121233 Transcript_48419/m.121233 type:complete len:114 (+) Transcript_48419:841-1182(+)
MLTTGVVRYGAVCVSACLPVCVLFLPSLLALLVFSGLPVWCKRRSHTPTHSPIRGVLLYREGYRSVSVCLSLCVCVYGYVQEKRGVCACARVRVWHPSMGSSIYLSYVLYLMC